MVPSTKPADSQGPGGGRLRRLLHRGAGGAGARPAPAGHVYRRHRREGAAPPLRRGDRQRHGRGGRRPRQLHRGRAGGGRLPRRHRQRPRHPGRPAPQVPEEVGARGHHDHAPRRRKVRLQGLRDLRRPARRRRLGGERPVRAAGGRGRARARRSTARFSPAACRSRSWKRSGRVQNRRGTRVRFRPDPQIFGEDARFQPRRLFKMARSKAYLFGGVEIRWRCAPALLDGADKVPAEASFRFPGGLKDYLAREIEGRELVAEPVFAGKIHEARRPRLARMGGGVARRRGRVLVLLLQHHPDARGRHPRERLSHRAPARASRPCRAGEPVEAHDARHHGRRHGDLRRHALRVHPRAGVPGPDQGQARDARSRRGSSRRRCATPSTTGSPPRRCRRAG